VELHTKRVERRPNLSSQVYDAIRDGIMTGTLRGGERLIVDRVAPQYGVSQTPVREALARLVQEGTLEESGPGRLRVVPLTKDYVLETYWVRAALEGLAAELAASRLTDDDLDQLSGLVDHATCAIERNDFREYAAADREIHRRVLVATGNRVLIRDLDALQSHIGYIRDYSHRHEGDQLVRANQEHGPILEALRARDAVTARRLMESHIRRSAERIACLVSNERAEVDTDEPKSSATAVKA
jgi:DNA-binding GntR family transcriptional regulator